MNKKIAVGGILVTCALAASVIGGTMAFLTYKDSAVNTFTVGHVNLDFDEPDWDPNPDPENPDAPIDGKDLVPGRSTDKTPVISSVDEKDNMPAYMRVKMELVDTGTNERITDPARIQKIMNCIRYDASGTGLSETVGTQGARFDQKTMDTFPTVNPMFVEDTTYTANTPGLYYFNYVGEDGVVDEPNGNDDIFYAGDSVDLFTNVVIPAEYLNEDMKLMGNYKIALQPQAIQAEGFANATEAFDALQGYDTTEHLADINDNTDLEKFDDTKSE